MSMHVLQKLIPLPLPSPTLTLHHQPLLNSDWDVLQQNVVVVAASIPVVVVGVGTAFSSRCWRSSRCSNRSTFFIAVFGSSLHQWQSLSCNKINFPNAPSLQRILDLFRFLCDWSTTSTPANVTRYIFSAGFEIIFPRRTTYRVSTATIVNMRLGGGTATAPFKPLSFPAVARLMHQWKRNQCRRQNQHHHRPCLPLPPLQ